MTSEPYTVERLREMMDGAAESVRECSTILWAADEIELLRDEREELLMFRAEIAGAIADLERDYKRRVHAYHAQDRCLNAIRAALAARGGG